MKLIAATVALAALLGAQALPARTYLHPVVAEVDGKVVPVAYRLHSGAHSDVPAWSLKALREHDGSFVPQSTAFTHEPAILAEAESAYVPESKSAILAEPAYFPKSESGFSYFPKSESGYKFVRAFPAAASKYDAESAPEGLWRPSRPCFPFCR